MKQLWLIALCACGGTHATGTVANQPAHAAPEPLGAVLARDIGAGQPVAIVGGASGVRALSLDGTRQRVLAPGAVRWVLVDTRANVVWFGDDKATSYRAIDLDAPAQDPPPVVTVATGLPSPDHVEMVGPTSFGVTYPDPDEPIGAAVMAPLFATGSCCATASEVLIIGAEPSVVGGGGYQQDEEFAAGFGKAQFPGKAFLAELAHRRDHGAVSPRHADEAPRVTVDASKCEDPSDCGKAEPIANTPFVRVIVAMVTGDVAHIEKRLYDTRAKRFVDADWGTWLQNATVAPDGRAFIKDGVVVRFDGGPIAATPPKAAALGGGWLGGGEFYGF